MRTRTILVSALLSMIACNRPGEPIVSFENESVAIYNAFAPASPAEGLGSLYFSIVNRSALDDSIVGVTLDGGRAELHRVQTGMQPVSSIAVEAGERVDLEPGGFHIMLVDLQSRLEVGDTLRAIITLSGAGAVNIEAPVLTYTEVVRNLARGVP